MSVTISDEAARFLHQLLDLARFNGADGKLKAALVQQELEQGLKEAMRVKTPVSDNGRRENA